MLHYLFTNDLRRNQWPEILVDSAKLIRDDAVPNQHEDKSKNNYINTQQSYLCIYKGTKANELCCKGDVDAVILNFINRFQFPNARTEESFNNAVADHMAVAPLRCVVQLLFVLGMVDAGQAYMDCPEFAKYIICNSDVAMGNLDLISLAQQIVSDRLAGVVIPPVPDTSTLSSMEIEWKHCPRQIGEVFYLLQFVPFIKLNGTRLELVMPSTIDANLAKMFFYIVNNHELWEPPNTSNWPDIQKSYLQYMDSGVIQYMTGGSNVGSESLSHVDVLTVALKMFAEKRKEEDWCSDKTDGDANKPRPGYIANKQLRVLSNTPADIGKLNGDAASNIKAWFKNYWNVADGKSWLNGLNDADLSGFGPYIVHLLQPNSPAVVRPDKFGNALEAAVKAVINPEETGMYDERVNEALKFLGLIGFGWNENFDADDLGEAVNAQRIIKRRLKDMGVKRIQESPTSDDGNAPDYLTVNEFLWFVKLNLNRIEKEVQEGKMKPATHKAIEQKQKDKKPKVDIKDSEDVLMLRLRAALRTKPFAILAGHSGTGKSRMVRKLAYMTCNDNALRYALDDAGNIKKDENGNGIFLKEPGNFCMVQVKPNWHDSSDLLGYYSELGKRYRSTDFVEFICKAYAYPNTPFFVCLDEMNLAPVEQYFAEYLSAIEGRKLTSEGVLTTDELIAKSAYTKEDATGKSVMYEWLGCTMTESRQWLETYGLTIPRNLFVVGTVNMDETTNQFSRKVLDRAMTIEMTDADFDSFGAKPSELKFDDEYMGDDAVKEMLSGEVQAKTLTTDQKNNLNALKAVLAPTSFAVAYRFANEYALYEESLTKTVDSSVKPNPPGTLEEVLTLPDPSSAAATAVPATASPEAAETVSAAEAAPAAEGETAEGTAASATTKKKDPAIPSAFDDMVLMKVLPRISGDEADVKQIFYEGRVVGKKGTRENPADKTLMKILDVSKDTESLRKIAAILDRGGTYLSFWP